MTPKDKAIELVENAKNYVHGYVGSSMLTNYEYPEQILLQAMKVATITADEIIKETLSEYTNDENHDRVKYWNEVKEEILKVDIE